MSVASTTPTQYAPEQGFHSLKLNMQCVNSANNL